VFLGQEHAARGGMGVARALDETEMGMLILDEPTAALGVARGDRRGDRRRTRRRPVPRARARVSRITTRSCCG
jgi:hypothetical protein